jgi:hypothetical protein
MRLSARDVFGRFVQERLDIAGRADAHAEQQAAQRQQEQDARVQAAAAEHQALVNDAQRWQT